MKPAEVESPSQTQVLLADDDDDLRRALERALARAGFTVTAVASGPAALAALSEKAIDVLISDIDMPGLSGIELLHAVQGIDRDLPVILLTGSPRLDTAMAAVNLGAYRYLTKPVTLVELERVVRRAGLVRAFAKLKQRALAVVHSEDAGRLGLDEGLNRCLDALWMAYQPIVSERGATLVGFEALMRTDDPELKRPDVIIETAQKLQRERELGRLVRSRVAQGVAQTPADAVVFTNLLPIDLMDPELFEADAPLSGVAGRVVLELTERATLDSISNLPDRVRSLREMGFRLAVDDLGAGYSGLSSITQLEPDWVKLDMSLIRGIHQSTPRQAVVRSMVQLCLSMNVKVIAEGIEEEAEAETLYGLDVHNFQGYLFAKPAREINWVPRAATSP